MSGACATLPQSGPDPAPSPRVADRAAESARLTLLTCVGCGAMSAPGSCPGGCGEERRLELVRGGVHDGVCAEAARLALEVDRLHTAVGHLAALPACPADLDQAIDAARETARTALGTCARPPARRDDDAEPVEAWACPRCGGVDAPRPCIGVCIREPVDWVPATRLAEAVARRDALRARRRALVGALTPVAHLHPRPGREQANWRALRRRVRLVS